MKCVHCGKQLPRSRRARRTAVWLVAWHKSGKRVEVHSSGCYKKRKALLDHAIYLWIQPQEAIIRMKSLLDEFTSGDNPLIIIKDE